MRRLVLFSGLGGDERLFAPLRVERAEVLAPRHLEPLGGEGLAAYAARCADAARLGPGDVVGGASFGGMLAAEIASRRRVAGLVVLGSCLDPRRRLARFAPLVALAPLIPDFLLRVRTWGPLMRRRFGPLTAEAERVLAAMAADCPPARLRAFGRMLFGWGGAAAARVPRLVVHGDADAMIPLAAAEPGLVLRGAGHILTLTHPAEVSAAIDSFLSCLPA